MDRDTELEGLIFVSSATKILSYDETETIINFYREDAKAKGITGLVIFASGSILRYVEGEKEKIITQYKLAQKNLQHFNLIKCFLSIFIFNLRILDSIHFELYHTL